MKQNNEINESIDLSAFTSKLKREDDRYSRICKGLIVVYSIFVLLKLASIIIHLIDETPDLYLLGKVSYLLGFLIFALLMGIYYHEYKFVDYSQPTLVMLKKAAHRYKPVRLNVVWAIVALFLVDLGISLETLGGFEFNWKFIAIQIMVVGALVIGLIIGLVIWRVRYKPLRDTALAMIREIEGEN